MLEHPEHGVASQAAKAAYPHRNVAAGKALGQDGTLCRNDFLAVEPGGRGIQQQVYGERGLVLLLGTAEDPAVVQQRSPPDPLRVQIAAAGDPGVGLLVDEDAVLDLLGQPEHHAAVELPVFGIVSPVAVGLLGQMFRFGGGGLLRAGHAGGKPQMAPQMVPGAELLLGLAQPFRRVERAAKAALDVGPVLGGVLFQCNMGQPLVGSRPAAARVHTARVLHRHPVGLDHLGGHGLGGKGGQKPLQVQVQCQFLVHRAVKEGKFSVKGQYAGFQFLGLGRCFRGQGRRQLAFVRGQHRVGPALYPPPAGGLHGVDQLVFRHPLLPRELVLDAEEIIRVGPPQLGQHRAAGQLQRVGGAFEVQPGQVVQQGLLHVAVPGMEQPPHKVVAVIFVHQPHDAVHVKIHGAIGVAGQKQRLKAVFACRGPHLIGGPPLLRGVALRFHRAAPQLKSLAAVSWAGMRAAMTSRMSPCS